MIGIERTESGARLYWQGLRSIISSQAPGHLAVKPHSKPSWKINRS